MLFCLWVPILFGHAEVDNVDDICRFRVGSTYQKVVRLDVSIDEVLLVNRLDSGKLLKLVTNQHQDAQSHHLLRNHHHGLD